MYNFAKDRIAGDLETDIHTRDLPVSSPACNQPRDARGKALNIRVDNLGKAAYKKSVNVEG